MYARSVSLRLKANLLPETTRTIQDEALPLLQEQTGSQGQITLAVPGGTEAVAISLGAKKECAEAYHRETHPQLQKPLEKIIDGPPAIQTYEVVNSIFHPVAAQAAASSRAMGVL